jgi:RNA polymerase sigma-70 factor, ECF subfamily
MPRAREPAAPIVAAAVAGDREAIGALLVRYGPMVYGLCRALDPQPDDAYQEIWERALRGLPRFDPGGSAAWSTWLYAVAQHHLTDRYRQRRTQSGNQNLADDAVAGDPSALERLEATEGVARLRAALAVLPEAQRRAVILYHLDEVPLAEVALREGVPIGTVKSRLHLGRGRLLALLGGYR